jgi:hypothetical protein
MKWLATSLAFALTMSMATDSAIAGGANCQSYFQQNGSLRVTCSPQGGPPWPVSCNYQAAMNTQNGYCGIQVPFSLNAGEQPKVIYEQSQCPNGQSFTSIRNYGNATCN